jgi:predicted alpha/beta-hydrolase family hydrolase
MHAGEPLPTLVDGPEDAPQTLILAHGAGAPMDNRFMQAFATGLAGAGIRVVRFEFPYMAARREGRRPGPDREAVLLDTWRAVVGRQRAGSGALLFIGGKSMGGRMASMVADELAVAGLVCLGYPFHPPGRPERTRTAHLRGLQTPALVVQGTRDPFGNPDDVAGYELSPAIRIHWLEDGDHDFKPRSGSGRTQKHNWDEGIAAVTAFVARG